MKVKQNKSFVTSGSPTGVSNLYSNTRNSIHIDFLLVFHPQALPKVPVPPLEQTMADYLKALHPITTPQQFEKAEKIIKQFSVSPGPKLHEYLVEKREAEDNWVS